MWLSQGHARAYFASSNEDPAALDRSTHYTYPRMTSDSGAVMTATIRRSGRSGVHMGSELRVLLIALLFLVVVDVGVRCISTANAQAPGPEAEQAALENSPTFLQFEAVALNAVLANWTSGGLNKQLSSLLGWSSQQHPCDNSNKTNYENGTFYAGAWSGVLCTPLLHVNNSTGNYFNVSVTTLSLYGSSMSCNSYSFSEQCGFEGIQGVLPSEIAQLTNLKRLYISYHPNLTGEVPLQIWQLPKLRYLEFSNNALQGTLPSNSLNLSTSLITIDLSNNSFSGMLEVSPNGTLFSSSLISLYLNYNQMYGPVDFQRFNTSYDHAIGTIDLSHNNFNGTFSSGPSFDPSSLFLSNNLFTSINFSNYTGRSDISGLVHMPRLRTLEANNNQLSGSFPEAIFMLHALQLLELSGNQLNGSFPVEILANLTNLTYLDVSRNHFSGSLSFQHIISQSDIFFYQLNFSNNFFDGIFSSGKYIDTVILDLSSNYFNDIHFDIFNGTLGMKTLEKLYIQHNRGSFAQFFVDIVEARKLQILNIQNNNLDGEFPIQILEAPLLEGLYADHNHFKILRFPKKKFENFTLYAFGLFFTNNSIGKIIYANEGPFSEDNLKISNYLFLAGNPLCKNIHTPLLSVICRVNRSADLLPLNVVQISYTNIKAIIATSTSAFGLILFIISIYVWRLMRRIQSLGMILSEFDKREVKPNLFSYKDIKLATKNFDKRNKLGEGGFGVVYKGILSDGTIVAVKKLTISSSQILSEFLNEVVVISGLIHRNLVKLKGCCLGDGDQRILVFEYVENKNLAEALSLSDDEEASEPLCFDWARRFNIIVGIARGLAYLHEDLQSPVIHRDIKATNILLDKDYNPKIADFGLAYLFPTLENNESHLTMVQVAGTRGYCAPEYVMHGHMSTSLDVYSFGILILEIVSGRKNIDLQRIGGEINLLDWAWELFEGQNLIALIDQRMKHLSFDVEAITRVINVALACAQFKAAMRPKMHEVEQMLLGNVPIIEIHKSPGGVGSSINERRYDATSSWEDKNVSRDELSLLSDSHGTEMSVRS